MTARIPFPPLNLDDATLLVGTSRHVVVFEMTRLPGPLTDDKVSSRVIDHDWAPVAAETAADGDDGIDSVHGQAQGALALESGLAIHDLDVQAVTKDPVPAAAPVADAGGDSAGPGSAAAAQDQDALAPESGLAIHDSIDAGDDQWSVVGDDEDSLDLGIDQAAVKALEHGGDSHSDTDTASEVGEVEGNVNQVGAQETVGDDVGPADAISELNGGEIEGNVGHVGAQDQVSDDVGPATATAELDDAPVPIPLLIQQIVAADDAAEEAIAANRRTLILGLTAHFGINSRLRVVGGQEYFGSTAAIRAIYANRMTPRAATELVSDIVRGLGGKAFPGIVLAHKKLWVATAEVIFNAVLPLVIDDRGHPADDFAFANIPAEFMSDIINL
ncbi:hypothetical protein H9P43_009084 [Blastocladiella emersonii ATCC 22665]|nr:hypothetical protein H9P43_009084 [Blastocladiella emersonii ATCC 22665]